MPRTDIPEEQKRAEDVSELKNIFPTEKRIVHIVSDPNGEPNFYYWDASGNPSLADGEEIIESLIPQFAAGGSKAGAWKKGRRDTTPLQGITSIPETAQDSVAAALTGGTNVSINYDDPGDEITISATPQTDPKITVEDNGGPVSTEVNTLDFGTGLDVTNPTQNVVEVSAASSTLLEVSDDGSTVESATTTMNLGDRISATSSAQGSVDVTVEDDLSLYDFSGVTVEDINVRDEFQAGGDITYEENAFNPYRLLQIGAPEATFDTSSQTNTPTSATFNGSGTKVFVSSENGEKIIEYSVSQPFDLSSGISATGAELSVSTEDVNPQDVAFNASGTKLYMIGGVTGEIYQYSLSSAYDLSSSVSLDTSFDTGAAALTSAAFGSGGSKLYVADFTNQEIVGYTLSTAFDLSSTITIDGTLDVSGQGGDITGVELGGGDLFTITNAASTVYKYDFNSSLSSATFSGETFDASSDTSDPRDLEFSNDGSTLFITGFGSNLIYQYESEADFKAEFRLDVSELSPTDLFGSKTTDNLPEGSSNLYYTDQRVSQLLTEGDNIDLSFGSGELEMSASVSAQDSGGSAVAATELDFGSGLSVTDNGDGTVTIESSTFTSISNGGTTITTEPADINFGTGLSAVDDGDGTVTINGQPKQFVAGTVTFSGDGIKREFSFSHGVTPQPTIWNIEPITDDGSSHSHSKTDANDITVFYDTPPPAGTDNIVLNYIIEE